jgi:hypothetical protein
MKSDDLHLRINTSAAVHRVSGGFVSFALDQPWLVNFSAAAAGRTVDFASPVLRAVVALVGSTNTASGEGGFIRLGGTYTDGVDYVGFGAAAQCVGRCIVLTPQHWRETLDFAHAVGMRVTLNLNAMHGRTGKPLPGYGCCGTANASEPFPPWNSTQSEALLSWTVKNILPERWPSWIGLGNEKTGLIPAPQYVKDLAALNAMLDRVFPAGRAPKIYAPCGCSKDLANPGLSSQGFLDGVAAAETSAGVALLGAFSWHSYPQLCLAGTTAASEQTNLAAGGILATAKVRKTSSWPRSWANFSLF